MKFVEEQLVSALRETPLETDCSVSIKVLESIGLNTGLAQQEWLSARRPPGGSRAWHMTAEHWEYGLPADKPAESRQLSYALPPRVSQGSARTAVSRIVVKPLPRLR